MNIRASALPKLAECARFEGKAGDPGPAAQRGSLIDEAFRLALSGDNSAMRNLPNKDDIASCKWAVEKAKDYSLGKPLETREEYLRMSVPGIANLGTADVRCKGIGWVGDLKTGQARNYREQLAAYALSCMEEEFRDSYAAHVFYCDQRLVASYRFTHGEAKQIVDTLLAKIRDPLTEPTGCEYCDWCKHSEQCTARVASAESAVMVLAEKSLADIREAILADPSKMSAFLKQWKVAEKEILEPVEVKAKEMLEADPNSLPGWRRVEVKGREYFDHIAIARAAVAGKAGIENLILALGGKMGGTKFRQWCEELKIPVTESLAKSGSPSTQLRQTNKK